MDLLIKIVVYMRGWKYGTWNPKILNLKIRTNLEESINKIEGLCEKLERRPFTFEGAKNWKKMLPAFILMHASNMQFVYHPINGCLRGDNLSSSTGLISWSRSTSLADMGLKEPAFCVGTAQQAMQLRSPELLASARNHPAWPSAPLRVRGARVAGRPNSLL